MWSAGLVLFPLSWYTETGSKGQQWEGETSSPFSCLTSGLLFHLNYYHLQLHSSSSFPPEASSSSPLWLLLIAVWMKTIDTQIPASWKGRGEKCAISLLACSTLRVIEHHHHPDPRTISWSGEKNLIVMLGGGWGERQRSKGKRTREEEKKHKHRSSNVQGNEWPDTSDRVTSNTGISPFRSSNLLLSNSHSLLCRLFLPFRAN